MGGYGADAAPRGVGGRREAQPFRHPALDPGPPVRTIKMVADDALQGLGLLARIGGGDRLARPLGDDPRQHFAVADQLEERPVSLPPVDHVDAPLRSRPPNGGPPTGTLPTPASSTAKHRA